MNFSVGDRVELPLRGEVVSARQVDGRWVYVVHVDGFWEPRMVTCGGQALRPEGEMRGLADDLAAAVQVAFAEMETDDIADLEPIRAAVDAYREGRLAGAS